LSDPSQDVGRSVPYRGDGQPPTSKTRSVRTDGTDLGRRHSGARETADDLLATALAAAVPLHILEVRGRGTAWLLGEARRCAGEVASRGDVLQYGGKGCAGAFNALARGLAVAALVADGGVTWRGQHWCATAGCRSQDEHLSTSNDSDNEMKGN
jgi:hypothetical protein